MIINEPAGLTGDIKDQIHTLAYYIEKSTDVLNQELDIKVSFQAEFHVGRGAELSSADPGISELAPYEKELNYLRSVNNLIDKSLSSLPLELKFLTKNLESLKLTYSTLEEKLAMLQQEIAEENEKQHHIYSQLEEISKGKQLIAAKTTLLTKKLISSLSPVRSKGFPRQKVGEPLSPARRKVFPTKTTDYEKFERERLEKEISKLKLDLEICQLKTVSLTANLQDKSLEMKQSHISTSTDLSTVRLFLIGIIAAFLIKIIIS